MGCMQIHIRTRAGAGLKACKWERKKKKSSAYTL